jgi:NAD(P)-dependent dehydrogenase (short-subunit alcohol dehydrogenase family)
MAILLLTFGASLLPHRSALASPADEAKVVEAMRKMYVAAGTARSAPQGRVVTVGSGSHTRALPGGIQFDELSGKRWANKAYAHSKLAKRLAGTAATSNCLTPGAVHTNIFRTWSKPVERETKAPEQGAATQCYVTTSPQLAKTTGEYFKDCNPAPQSDYQRLTQPEIRARHA